MNELLGQHTRAKDAKPCPWCKAMFPDISGPTHRYLESSPGCWAAYGDVLAREYSDRAYFSSHRLTVDAYSAQHPGQPSPQSIQSTAVHLVSLCLVLECGVDQLAATRLLNSLTESKGDFQWLEPPSELGSLTVKDVLATTSAKDHINAVDEWARAVWHAWREHHMIVREWGAKARQR